MDALAGDLMRVADDPLLLQTIVGRHGTEAADTQLSRHLHLRDNLLRIQWQTGRQKGQKRHYGLFEPLLPVSLRPEEFEPCDVDKKEALWVPRGRNDASSVSRHGGLAISVVAAVALALFLVGAFM
jgi:hypothetical protein